MSNIYNAIQNLYNMDKMTWQEVLAELYNLVADVTQKFEAFEQKFEVMIGKEVTKAIKKMYEDGTLAEIINKEVFKDLNNKIDKVEADLLMTLTDYMGENNKKLEVINEQLDNIENNVMTEYYVNSSNTIDKILNLMSEDGGAIILPHGTFSINATTLTKPIQFVGKGNTTILNVYGEIKTGNGEHRVSFKDLKLVKMFSGGNMLTLNEGSHRYMINNVWFHNENDSGILLNIDGADRITISDCWFTSKTNVTDTTAIKINNRSLNISFNGCMIELINKGIVVIGDSEHWQWTAGIRIIDTLVMHCVIGVYWENCDYMTFDNSMIDYCEKPIVIKNVSCPRIRNNYIFSYIIGDVISITQTIESRYFNRVQISGNVLWNSAFTGLSNQGNAIHIVADGVSHAKGLISDNVIQKVSKGIYFETKNGGKISYYNLSDLNGEDVIDFIHCDSGTSDINIVNCETDTTVINRLVNSGTNIKDKDRKIVTKDIVIPLKSGITTAQASLGFNNANVVGIMLIQSDNVYYTEPTIALTTSNNIWVVCRKAPSGDINITVRVSYFG